MTRCRVLGKLLPLTIWLLSASIQLFGQQYTPEGYSASVDSPASPPDQYGESPDYYPSRPYRSEIGRKSRYQPNFAIGGLYRQPTSIAIVGDSSAIIGTRKTGQLFELDLHDWSTKEVFRDRAASWGDICTLSKDSFAVADQERNEVVIFQIAANGYAILQRLPAPGHPNSIAWNRESQHLYCTTRWGRQLIRWTQVQDESAEASSTDSFFVRQAHVDLPMAGGQLVALPKQRLVMVVDAFGRDFAMIAMEPFEIVKAGQLYGHNITGLASKDDDETVFFPHQLLNEYAQSVVNEITWGGLMSNNLRWLKVDRLVNLIGHEMFKKGRFYPLGTPGNGAGDPSSMAVSAKGRIAVTLGGTNRAAIGKEGDFYFKQVEVGLRPVDCVYSPDDKHLIVVNQFSDSLSVVSVDSFEVEQIELGPLRTPTLTEFGEQAFYDSRQSHDGWMSCHSCHSDGHTNGQLNDNFTDKTFGTPKRVLSLLGQGRTMPYSWSGQIATLEDQVQHSLRSTMAANAEPSEFTIQAISAYVRTLRAPASVNVARQSEGQRAGQDSANDRLVAQANSKIQHGQRLFAELNCSDCHAGNLFTTEGVFDVGLHDENKMKRFNPPSLLAVSQRQNALFHDGRAKSIREVVEQEQHQLPRALNQVEIDQLISYLQSL